MTIPQIKDTLQDNQSNYEEYIKQLDEANKQRDTDWGSMQQSIATMVEQLKTNPQAAFQTAQMCVLPGAMTVQGDAMGQLAGAMNVGSAMVHFTTDAQNDLNAADKGGMTKDQADQFVKYIKQVFADVQAELKLKDPHLDPITAGHILDSLNKIAKEFGADSPDKLDADTVRTDSNNWIAHPTERADPSDPMSQTGQQCVQDLQASFAQWGNAESAQSQSLQAREQFETQLFTQWMGSLKSMFQAQQQSNEAMVRGQRS